MIPVTLSDGVVLNVHDVAGEQLSEHIIREQDYFEKNILEYLQEKYPTHETILDIGANIGNHTTYFAKYLYYNEIVAFEPIPENFELLKVNTKNFTGINLRKEAVGDGVLDVKMIRDWENMGACEVNPKGDVIVHQTKLDNLLVGKVTLIKIDVEWYEPFVLLGARNIINEDRPLILIEDSKDEYSSLLPDFYRLIKAWPEHRTYLYGA